MKMTYVAPDASIEEDISNIESNTGITNFEPEVPEAPDKEENNTAIVGDGKVLIASIASAENKRAEQLSNYDKLTNTELKEIEGVTDLSSLDMSSEIDLDSVDFEAAGLPDPRDYDMTLEEVMNFSAVNGSDWPLPKPNLAKLDPGCYDLDDMYLSSLVDLSGLDMRDWDLPKFDFSFADDWDFPDWMDPSSIDAGSLFDFSDFDLSGVIDLSDVKLPDFLIPEDGWNLDWEFDLSGEYDGLKGIFSDMGSSGDLLGMGTLASLFNGIGCTVTSIVDICTPDAVINAIKNFDIPNLSSAMDGTADWVKDALGDGMSLSDIADLMNMAGYDDWKIADKIFNVLDFDKPIELPNGLIMEKTDAKGPVLAALSYLGDDWWWYDKKMNKWDYDALSGASDFILWCISDEPNYEEVVHAAVGFRLHRYR